MIVTTAELFEVAYGKFAVGAYNINNMEQCIGLFQGCLDSQAPFIIQISRGARNYARDKMLEAMIRSAEEVFPEAIFAVHLDHGDEETCYDCIDSGFYSSVMIDASHEPFEENVAITRRVVERAHAKGISVEAELGMLGGVEEDIAVDEKHAMPDRPRRGSRVRGADAAATAWRWPSAPATGPTSSRAARACTSSRLAEIQQRLPGFPLVMHGSSSVPREEVERINAAGGAHGSLGQGRGRGRVRQGRAAGRDQGQHRHRRPPGLDARPPRVSSATSRKSSTSAGRARSLWPSTPSLSPTRTSSWAAPGGWRKCGGRWGRGWLPVRQGLPTAAEWARS